jgi:hypothetical protein
MGAAQQANQERGRQGLNIHGCNRSKSKTPAAVLQPVNKKKRAGCIAWTVNTVDRLPATGAAAPSQAPHQAAVRWRATIA